MKEQQCASAFVIDPKTKKILLMYNKKLNKWLQPGGHIENYETKKEAAIREVYQETGVKAKIVGEFIDIKHYDTVIGEMVDTQFFAVPINNCNLQNNENNLTGWFLLDELKEMQVEKDIQVKAKKLILRTIMEKMI